jgi:phosphoglucosamine mutase
MAGDTATVYPAVCYPFQVTSEGLGAMGRLFGTDGVRGRANADLTPELALAVAVAAAQVLAERDRSHAPLAVVGRDPRASGEMLEAAVVAGLTSAGANVARVGVLPTPAVAFLTGALGADLGVTLSASHNPMPDNGIKLFATGGHKLPDEIEDEIEAEIHAGSTDGGPPGRVVPVPDGRGTYGAHVLAAAETTLEGMRIVVDCANGAASELAPRVLRELGTEVEAIFCDPDGTNINVGCGALHPEVVAEAVRASGADAGVSLDGDADRALFSDAQGSVIDGDQVMAACAIAMRDAGELRGNLVVTTVMANLGFMVAMEEAGIEVVRTSVGDRYVLEEMLARSAVLGGEQSGHVIFADRETTGDGLLTAVRFLSLARSRGKSVAGFAAAMHRFPQVLRSVPVARKHELPNAAVVWEAVRTAEEELGTSGRVLVRASGTEAIVRVMVEADDHPVAERHADALAELVRTELG